MNSFFKELLRTTRYQTCWCKSDKNHWFFKVFKDAHLVPKFRYLKDPQTFNDASLKNPGIFFRIPTENFLLEGGWHETSIFIDRIESRKSSYLSKLPQTFNDAS